MKWLRRPYPLNQSLGRKWVVILCFSLFIFLFLFLFAPFGLNGVQPYSRFVTACAMYGGVTFATLVLNNFGLPLLFPRYFTEERWTVGREILQVSLTILLISGGNLVLSWVLGFYPLTLAQFFFSIWVCLLVGIFPVTVLILLRQMLLMKKNLAAAAQITTELPALDLTPHPVITLTGEGKKDIISLEPAHLIRLSSADNYSEIWFLENGQVRKSLLRASLRQLETQLGVYGEIVRVHRSHLINLRHVKSVEGNSQGLRVTLSGLDDTVPVSRNFQPHFREQLHILVS